MDCKNYLEKKTKGTAEIIKAGGGYAFAVKKFNVETGEPLAPEIESLDLTKLEEEKVELFKKIDDIDAVIADANELE